MGHVTFLLLLIFLISIRIAINAALVLVVPLLVVGASALLAFILPPLISYALASMLGLGVIILASYLLAYVSMSLTKPARPNMRSASSAFAMGILRAIPGTSSAFSPMNGSF